MDEPISTPPSSQQLASNFDGDDCRWEAVKSRNAKADGLFVYAVRSTGVYSRPTCKARLAHRFNIAFFRTGAQAQGAGYRPCKRCHPEAGVHMPEEDGVSKIRTFLRERPPGVTAGKEGTKMMLSLSQMARQAGLSKWHFHREFKKCFGVTPVEYLRMERKATRLASGKKSEGPSLLSGRSSHISCGKFLRSLTTCIKVRIRSLKEPASLTIRLRASKNCSLAAQIEADYS
jgi:methylphosphotriester-DNA--protein-cysteine methyltransferase